MSINHKQTCFTTNHFTGRELVSTDLGSHKNLKILPQGGPVRSTFPHGILGNMILEAMAYGLPCIGVDRDAMPEIIQQGETG